MIGKRVTVIGIISAFMLFACRTTVDMEKKAKVKASGCKKAEIAQAIQADEAPSPPEKEIVYVAAPDIISGEVQKEPSTVFEGSEALKQNLKDKTVLPKYVDRQLKGWVYQKEQIYQIHTQVYHSTIIQLEPGEEMLETPYISEPDVWRISRGVGLEGGLATQFIMIKPDFSGMDSTLIIITNKRVYQIQLKSYKDHYMPYVKWLYNNGVEDLASWKSAEDKGQCSASGAVYGNDAIRAGNMSFDYTVNYPRRKKPVWCPTLVYDDGQKTVIVLDKKSMNMERPAVFKNNSEIVNSQTDKNVIVLHELIEKVTLKLGSERVIITKKRKVR